MSGKKIIEGMRQALAYAGGDLTAAREVTVVDTGREAVEAIARERDEALAREAALREALTAVNDALSANDYGEWVLPETMNEVVVPQTITDHIAACGAYLKHEFALESGETNDAGSLIVLERGIVHTYVNAVKDFKSRFSAIDNPNIRSEVHTFLVTSLLFVEFLKDYPSEVYELKAALEQFDLGYEPRTNDGGTPPAKENDDG